MNEATVVIGLELDEETDTLTGRITRPDGELTEFRGWVGLIAALDALVRGCEIPTTFEKSPRGGTS